MRRLCFWWSSSSQLSLSMCSLMNQVWFCCTTLRSLYPGTIWTIFLCPWWVFFLCVFFFKSRLLLLLKWGRKKAAWNFKQFLFQFFLFLVFWRLHALIGSLRSIQIRVLCRWRESLFASRAVGWRDLVCLVFACPPHFHSCHPGFITAS